LVWRAVGQQNLNAIGSDECPAFHSPAV